MSVGNALMSFYNYMRNNPLPQSLVKYNNGNGGSRMWYDSLNPGQQNWVKQVQADIPGIGWIQRAINSYRQTMDLYDSTGRVSAYPGGTNIGTFPSGHNSAPDYVPKRDLGHTGDLDKYYMYF